MDDLYEGRARDAIRRRLRFLRMSQRTLAARSKVDKGTLGRYLAGQTVRCRPETMAAIEVGLGWPQGAAAAIAAGQDAEPFITRSDDTQPNVSDGARFVVNLPAGWDSGMSELARRAALRRAEAAALDALAQAQRDSGYG